MSKLTLIGMYNYYNQLGKDLFSTLSFPDGVDKQTVVDRILIRGGEFETLYSDPDFLNYSFTSFSKSWYRTFEKWVNALAIDYNPLENYDRIEDITDVNKSSNVKTGNESDNGSSIKTGNESDNGSSIKTGNESDNGSKVRSGSEQDQSSNTKSGSETIENTTSAFNATGYTPHDKSDTSYNNVTDTSSNTHTYSNVTDTNTNTHTYNDVTDANTNTHTYNDVTDTNTNTHTYNNVTDTNTNTHTYNDVTDISNSENTHHARMHGNIGTVSSQKMLEDELRLQEWNLTEKIVDIFLKEYVLPIY